MCVSACERLQVVCVKCAGTQKEKEGVLYILGFGNAANVLFLYIFFF